MHLDVDVFWHQMHSGALTCIWAETQMHLEPRCTHNICLLSSSVGDDDVQCANDEYVAAILSSQ